VTDDIDPKDMQTDELPRSRSPPDWFSDWTLQDKILLALLYALPFIIRGCT
jgi:hypothetical protein